MRELHRHNYATTTRIFNKTETISRIDCRKSRDLKTPCNSNGNACLPTAAECQQCLESYQTIDSWRLYLRSCSFMFRAVSDFLSGSSTDINTPTAWRKRVSTILSNRCSECDNIWLFASTSNVYLSVFYTKLNPSSLHTLHFRTIRKFY